MTYFVQIILEDEEWKVIKEFPSYMISSYGRVYSIKNKKILKPQKRPNGYLKVSLSRPDGPRDPNVSIHVLVAKYFCGNDDPSNKIFVNHISGVKCNNYYKNLEWVTPSENNIHAIENGLAKARGSENPTSIYEEDTIRMILYYINRGYTQGQIYELVKDRKNIVNRKKTIDLIKKLRRGVVWKHVISSMDKIIVYEL